MAQGQGGAWCKAGESGGSSESLLRQWQRFLVRFPFITGLGEGCSVIVLPQHSRQEVASSCDRTQRHMSRTRAAGGSVSCRNIWQVGRSLISLSPTALLQPGSAALSLDALLRAVPGIVAPMAEGSGYPMPALKQSWSCGETWGQELHLLLVSCMRLRICRLPDSV